MRRRGTVTWRGVPVHLRWIALGWVLAECAVFALFVKAIGFGATVLLGLGTTVLGMLVLRRLGGAAVIRLRDAVVGHEPPADALLDGLLRGLGGVLLIVPGFLANAAGLALAAPSVRRRAATLVGAAGAPGDPRLRQPRPGVVDLGPADWQAIDRP